MVIVSSDIWPVSACLVLFVHWKQTVCWFLKPESDSRTERQDGADAAGILNSHLCGFLRSNKHVDCVSFLIKHLKSRVLGVFNPTLFTSVSCFSFLAQNRDALHENQLLDRTFDCL